MESGKEREDLNVRRNDLLLPIFLILFLMICMVLYTSRVILKVAVANVREVGEDRISGISAELENYIETTKTVLWVTADTVDHMVGNGASSEEILRYITTESTNQEQHFDENYTGIYGYIGGEYLDGVGWVPPKDYDPLARDWYLSAIEAGGEPTIVSPYVDAQTNAVIISISQMLSNGVDALSMDVRMDYIQEVVSDIQIKGKGYGFIVNEDGMIIAHNDENRKGRYLDETEEQREFMENVLKIRSGDFEMVMDGRKCTVFVEQIMDQWYVAIVVSNAELYAEVWQQIAVNVTICVVIFGLITLFYVLGRRNEQNYSRRIEEMRADEQKKIYEAKALKLEKEAADQANKAKSNFLAEMSHEIRTPINAVLGMNEMILRESLGAQQLSSGDEEKLKSIFHQITTYSGNIASAGSSLLSIINDILDFSKIEAGKMDIVNRGYRLSAVLKDVSNMIFFKAKEKNLEFTVHVDESLPDGLLGDEVRIRQVMVNILNNAVKYTNVGSVILDVRGEDERGRTQDETVGQEQTITLVISVQDTGIGIKEEDIGKLFTKFQRVDLKQNSTIEGTGLGLAITQSLLEMMGGSIRVESVYGCGSTFIIRLPQVVTSREPVGDIKADFEEEIPPSEKYQETFLAPDARILVVDDTKMNLAVVSGFLKDTKIRIDTATGGAEAIKLAESTAYDVILLDQRMPKMDGTEALHLIQADEAGKNRKTPVICLTADAVMGAKERYIAEGFVDYMSKPIDSQALEQMLIRYLPEEKVKVISKEEKHTETADVYSELRDAGIDTETGMKYCMRDEGFYRSMLREYADAAEEKLANMQAYYDAGAWQDYSILVHAVKSTSKTIGAVKVSEIAFALEKASKAAASDTAEPGNAEILRRDHPVLLQKYKAVAEAISGMPSENPGSGADAEDFEIMEFMPESGDVL